jgi:hypothetical protein
MTDPLRARVQARRRRRRALVEPRKPAARGLVTQGPRSSGFPRIREEPTADHVIREAAWDLRARPKRVEIDGWP